MNVKGTQKAREVIRRHVAHLEVDRPLFNDHNAMKALVKSGEILDEVEKELGAVCKECGAGLLPTFYKEKGRDAIAVPPYGFTPDASSV
ncbi:MAG: hypothetical protein L6461_11305 [Anaerolineae bacterium]|nr:hypothetical protein [Anaerolineae bacterium]